MHVRFAGGGRHRSNSAAEFPGLETSINPSDINRLQDISHLSAYLDQTRPMTADSFTRIRRPLSSGGIHVESRNYAGGSHKPVFFSHENAMKNSELKSLLAYEELHKTLPNSSNINSQQSAQNKSKLSTTINPTRTSQFKFPIGLQQSQDMSRARSADGHVRAHSLTDLAGQSKLLRITNDNQNLYPIPSGQRIFSSSSKEIALPNQRQSISQVKKSIIETIDSYQCGLEEKLIVLGKLYSEVEAELNLRDTKKKSSAPPIRVASNSNQRDVENALKLIRHANRIKSMALDQIQGSNVYNDNESVNKRVIIKRTRHPSLC